MKEKNVTLRELGKTVMPIIGFWGPGDGFKNERWDKKSLKTDEVFTLIKDAGFNMYLQGYDDWNNNSQGAKKAFEMCNKYNLFYYVSDRELCSFPAYHNPDGGRETPSVEEIEETIKDYIHEPCVAGLLVVDEPSANAMEKIGAFLENYKKALKNLGEQEKGYYINLFPVLPLHGAPTIDCYKDYLRKAIEEGKLEYISHDMYPFQIPGKSISQSASSFNLLPVIRHFFPHLRQFHHLVFGWN